ncbi:hypothetical protein Tco_0905412 [Tanacetum coccineum]
MLDDDLPLGRANGTRFKGMIMKEMDTAGSVTTTKGMENNITSAHGRYGVSVPALTKDHEGNKIQYAISRRRKYAVFKLYGNILEDIKRGPYSKKPPICHIQDFGYADSTCLGLRKKYRLSLKNDMPPRDKMDNSNIPIEEYIRLEEEKARRRGQVYNWETATYSKIWRNEDVRDPRSIEIEFPAIVYNDAFTSE